MGWLPEKLYPEIGAGGFSRVDGTVEFYGRVNSLLTRDMTVLDFGAGRGREVLEDQAPYRRALRLLKGKAAKVIGVDVDPIVLSNPSLDEAMVITEDGALPVEDASIDVIVSDFCFEHLRHPERVAGQFHRVLKMGGWICARTPNRWGYIGLGATLVPNQLHHAALRRLQPQRRALDVFPTVYRLNTRRAVRRCFPPEDYRDCSYTINSIPAYCGNSLPGAWVCKRMVSLLPESVSTTLLIFLQKRAPTRAGERR
ncbi:MAG: class I SAM-dependent methyltransferase [Egibacteraceae bacterium]